MNIKKITVSAIAAALSLSLTACVNQQSVQTEPQTNAPQTSQSETPTTQAGAPQSSQTEPSQSAAQTEPQQSSAQTEAPQSSAQTEPPQSSQSNTALPSDLPDIPVSAASAFLYEFDDDHGGICITDYLGDSPKVSIPGTIDGKPVIEVELDDCKKEITYLIMPEGVIEFELPEYTKSSLEFIYIPSTVIEIDSYAFRDCTRLTRVAIPENVIEIGEGAFYACSGLTDVNIPGSVREIEEHTFHGCTSLTSIAIPEGVVEIDDWAFRSCSSLESITVPDSVIKIGDGIFEACTSLTSITYKGQTYNKASDFEKAFNKR